MGRPSCWGCQHDASRVQHAVISRPLVQVLCALCAAVNRHKPANDAAPCQCCTSVHQQIQARPQRQLTSISPQAASSTSQPIHVSPRVQSQPKHSHSPALTLLANCPGHAPAHILHNTTHNHNVHCNNPLAWLQAHRSTPDMAALILHTFAAASSTQAPTSQTLQAS
jgi:hypothetical protein